jgi:hypothetical protein
MTDSRKPREARLTINKEFGCQPQRTVQTP